MEAKDYVIISVVTILSVTSVTMYKSYRNVQSEAKNVDSKITLSKEETRRMEVLRDAMKEVSHVSSIKSDAEEFYNKVLRSSASAERLHFAGHTINKEQISKLNRGTRSTAQEVCLNGVYRILRVDSSKPGVFKVDLLDEQGRRFPAVLDETVIITKEKNRELLQDAEWQKKPIALMVDGTELRGEITTAKILDVTERYAPAN